MSEIEGEKDGYVYISGVCLRYRINYSFSSLVGGASTRNLDRNGMIRSPDTVA